MADFKVLDDDWYNFTSVSEAESTTYSQPCVVSVKDTGRVYQFDPASTATRDGDRYLNTAGGGRLLAVKGLVSTDGVHLAGDGGADNPIEHSQDTADLFRFFVGAIISGYSAECLITSNGSTVTASVQSVGGGDIRYVTTDGYVTLDCTPAATVALTAGTDSAPVVNWIYIDIADGLLKKSTTGFPSSPYVPIDKRLIPSASFVQTYGTYPGNNFSDHVYSAGDNGHLTHINQNFRLRPPVYTSGASVTISGSGTANCTVAVASGEILMNHPRTTYSFVDGSNLLVANDQTTPYKIISNLYNLTTDTTGATLIGRWAAHFIWYGHAQEQSGAKLFLNKPSGTYLDPDVARADSDGYFNSTVPPVFRGCAIGLRRVIARRSATGTIEINYKTSDDWRGKPLSSVAGSGGTTSFSSVFPASQFRVEDDTDASKKFAVNASAIGTGQTRNILMPDRDVDLAPASRMASPSQSGLMSANAVIAADVKNLSYEGKRIDIVNPYLAKTNVYKGQLHIHTTNSDGAQSPSVVATAYRDAGYDFINLSDHNFITPDPGVSGILSISGDEETQSTGHILRVKAATDSSSSDHQTILNHSESEGSFSVMAHPNYPGATWTDVELESLYKYQAVEIWNNAISPDESAESDYDVLITKYKKVFLIASDDSHDINAAYSKKTAVMVFSNSLTVNDIIDSLKRGNYYSIYTPSGADVDLSISVSGDIISASVALSSTIEFIVKGGAVRASSVGTSALYTVVGDEIYVRVRVTNGSTKAWSNPIFINQQHDANYSKGGIVDGNIYVTGNIGAGGTNPQEKLDVSGNVRLTTSTPEIKSIGGAAFAANTVFRPYTANTNGRIVVAPSGTATESNVIVQTSSSVDLAGSYWLGIGGGFGGAISGTHTIGSMVYAQTTTNSLPITFALSNTSGRFEAGRITNSGNLGLGQNAPTARIQAKVSTSDSTTVILKAEDSLNSEKLSVRGDGQFATYGSRIAGYDTFTADTTLTQSSKSCAVINPSGTGVVITMHLSPADGIKQLTVNVSAFAVTLGRNSQKMARLEANYTLPAYTAIDWQYYGATIGWLPISISTW